LKKRDHLHGNPNRQWSPEGLNKETMGKRAMILEGITTLAALFELTP